MSEITLHLMENKILIKPLNPMKFTLTKLIPVVFGSLLLTSCATIVGGSKYNAHIVVNDRPNAKIIYQGQELGTGNATIKVKRKDANKLVLAVKEEGCPEQNFNYNSRTFRGWAFVGTIVTWTGVLNGTPLPWGMVVDLATGAVWKPNVSEKGVIKEDYKNFKYILDYQACASQNAVNTKVSIDVVQLKNGSIIKGTIIEQVPDSQIKIKTKDENIFVYKMDEIEKITKE